MALLSLVSLRTGYVWLRHVCHVKVNKGVRLLVVRTHLNMSLNFTGSFPNDWGGRTVGVALATLV